MSKSDLKCCLLVLNFVILFAALIIIIVVEVSVIRGWTKEVANAVVNNDVDNIGVRTHSMANLTRATFLDMEAELWTARNYTEKILAGTLSRTGVVPPSFRNAPSYAGNRAAPPAGTSAVPARCPKGSTSTSRRCYACRGTPRG